MKEKLLSKHTFLFFAGDVARLQSLHPNGEASTVLRTILHAYLNKHDPKIDTSKINSGDLDV